MYKYIGLSMYYLTVNRCKFTLPFCSAANLCLAQPTGPAETVAQVTALLKGLEEGKSCGQDPREIAAWGRESKDVSWGAQCHQDKASQGSEYSLKGL